MRKIKKWDSDLDVGIGLVDNQHKIIFDLVNDLDNATEVSADRKVIDTLLDVIENYVFRHFETEEEMFQNQKGSIEHSLEHYNLIKEFRKFRLSFRNRNNSETNISKFLESWFFDHIKNNDIPIFTRIAFGHGDRDKYIDIDEYPFEQKDRRKHQRIISKKITDDEIVANCYNTYDLKNSNVTIVDISLGGMRIWSSGRYSLNDLLVISCVIGNQFKMNEKIQIMNVADQYYGAEFVNLSPTTEKFLVELYGAVNLRKF